MSKAGDELHAGKRRVIRARGSAWRWFILTSACAVLLVLGLALLIQQVFTVSQGSTDFCQDYIAAKRLITGEAPYLPLQWWSGSNCYLITAYDAHPPSSVLFFLPFALLPNTPAALIWGLGSLAAYLGSGALMLQALGWGSLRGSALFVIGSAYWQPLVGAEGAQNLWQVLLLLVVGAWLLERKHHPVGAGLLLGVASLLKIWPIFLLLGALARRQWRLALVGGAALLLGTLLALAVMGPDVFAAYLGPVQARETEQLPFAGNISVAGVVARLFTGDPALGLLPIITTLKAHTALVLGEVAAALVLLGTLAFVAWYSHRRQEETGALLCQGMIVTAVILAFPLTWHFGIILLTLPATMLVLAVRRLGHPPRWWWALAAGILPLLAPYSMLTWGAWLSAQPGQPLNRLAMVVLAAPTLGIACFVALQIALFWGTKTPVKLPDLQETSTL